MDSSKRVLITGASGFVGHAVVSHLLRSGHNVTALIRSREPKITHERLRIVRGDLFDASALQDATAGVDAVVHLVGIIFENKRRGITFERIHVEGTQCVLDAAVSAGVKRFVHMSALGAKAGAPARYQQTKFAAEQLVQTAGLKSQLAWTIFRPSMIIGKEGDFTKQIISWAKGGAVPWLFMPYFAKGVLGRGKSTLVQPVSVEDVADAFVRSIETPRTRGRIYNVAGPVEMTWPEMYHAISKRATGSTKPALGIPLWYAGLLARVVPGFLLPFNLDQVRMAAQDNVGDIVELIEDLDWHPRPLEEIDLGVS